ncbi:MAG TPA: class I SAM-dependent methyltransferase [Leptospiraceae bacterium]|nr:class I SAM-dependent methyltransferase [Leptospiraceae bacterium]HMY65123.1 class I SAM-dependent methyltransferase [Leptospiraceae bacterium]HNF13559.1 class I SAM-dependent methyltransferase [Leptospiraceae bacterium]HNF26400.1 class I SAM-dependent methyltransferase [Leptospiraceae bacterium]HNI98573.1 class I SAM-dependent methyltransferase [Leptospiraceae bacterium]
MNLFNRKPHPAHPEYYEICTDTGACFYLKAERRIYSDSYFTEEFKAQYNKTYYEDEENLRKMARERLAVLEKKTRLSGLSLLEIGSAAGFFLSEAKKKDLIAKGLEISNTEAEYAKRMGLDVDCVPFEDFNTEKKFDIICAFFVLEHFPDQEASWRKIFSLLQPGGFLFLALPSLNGPTFRTDSEEWFKTHPTDHFADYSPDSLKKIFRKFNAELIFQKPMSYHPARDKGWRGSFPFRYFYRKLADLSCYGDTVQILARKKNEI